MSTSTAANFGALLGVIAAHGLTNVQEAVRALRSGTASPTQQRIAWEVLSLTTDELLGR